MIKTIKSYKIFLLVLLSFFSFSINYYYGNIGVFPIDTFAFFDTAYNILLNRLPKNITPAYDGLKLYL